MLLLQQAKPESKNVTSFTSQEIFMMLCAAVWRSRASSSSESAEMFFFSSAIRGDDGDMIGEIMGL